MAGAAGRAKGARCCRRPARRADRRRSCRCRAAARRRRRRRSRLRTVPLGLRGWRRWAADGTAAVSDCRRRFRGRGRACRPDRHGDAPRRPGRPGPARRSVPGALGTAWRIACATARCAAKCAPAASAGAGWPAAMRPTRAASTLSGGRWRVLAVARRRPGAVSLEQGEHAGVLWRADREAFCLSRWGLSPCTPFPCRFGPLAFNRFGIAGPGLRFQRQCGTRTNGLRGDQPLASAYAAETLFSPGRLLSGVKVDKCDKGD